VIGLDTNVLLRLLVKDDIRQMETAARAVAQRCTAESPGYVNQIVLCEVVWVLQAALKYPREAIAAAVEALCRASDFRIEHMDAVREALSIFRASKADYADCLIGVLNRRAGCLTTLTFDKHAAALPEFQQL
jgi:predicted nucleic-acid-binding protein